VINASVVFWVFLGIFVVVGMMRGWQREIIATASIVLALFALSQLNISLRLTSLIADAKLDGLAPAQQLLAVDAVKVKRFFILAAPFMLITFFGYLGPTLTRQLSGGRFGDRARARLQDSLIGVMIGALNGWLIISTLVRFAYNNGLLPDQGQFPSAGAALFLPPAGGWSKFIFIEYSALVTLTGPLLIVALVLLFIFVIVAFI